eukprot:376277_1
MTNRVITTLLALSTLLPIITGTDITGTYSTDFTFTVADSPYQVIGPITFESTSHVNIENGAKITFLGSYQIKIKGSINCGCYDGVINSNLDTLSFRNRGLA